MSQSPKIGTFARITLELEFEIDTEAGYTLLGGSKTHGLFDMINEDVKMIRTDPIEFINIVEPDIKIVKFSGLRDGKVVFEENLM
jgi:hypothetical protein